jgi:predicted TIM-barrel enzyme
LSIRANLQADAVGGPCDSPLDLESVAIEAQQTVDGFGGRGDLERPDNVV